MVTQCTKDLIFDKIYNYYSNNGFILEENISNELISNNFSLTDIEYFCQRLSDNGVIILQNVESNINVSDYGFIDYSSIYNEIISIDENLSYIINYIKNIIPPQRHEFNNLFIQARNGNAYAKNRIIEMNMRVAIRQALYFSKKYEYDLCECIQDAFLGLLLGYEKYNEDKKLKFQIHSVWWIRQSLYREVKIGNLLIRYPSHLKEKIFKVFHLYKGKSQRYKDTFKNQILYKTKQILHCSSSKAKIIFNIFNDIINIDYLLNYHQELLSDLGEYEERILERLTNTLLKEKLLAIINTIPEKEQKVIECRFGINSVPMTLETLGVNLGVTRERIRQIETKALRRLRHPSRCTSLLKFFENEVNLPSDKDLPRKQKFIEK